MKEQAIEYFKFYRKIFCEDYLKSCPKDSIAYQATLKEKEFYDMAIKALEQELILDKIRAEIEQIIREEIVVDCAGGEYERIISTIDPDDVLEIIDKYKTESEE